MRRKPDLSPFAIRKAVITTFVFGSGRCRGSSPERGTPKPCRNVSASAGDGECGTSGKDFRPVFFFCPAKRCGNGRPMPAGTTMPCDLGPLGRQKSVFPPATTYLARRTAIHGLERTWGTTCVLRAYFYGRSARLLSFIRFTHLKLSKPMAVLCIDEKVWQAFVGRLETLAERARLLEHRYEPRTDSS